MKMPKKVISILMLTIFTLFSLGGCGKEKVDTAKEAKGYQWKVSKGEDIMYLVGTIHVANREYDYLNENIEKMLKESDGLAVEVDITSAEVLEKSINMIYYPPGQTVEKELTNEEIDKLRGICKEIGLDYETSKNMTPSTILSFIQMYFTKASGNTEEGVDSKLLYNIKDNKKEVFELERAEDQFKMLEELQGIEALKKTINEHEINKFVEGNKKALDEARKLMEAYVSGDVSFIEKAASDMKKEDLKSYNMMLKDRNIGMVNKSIEIFEKKGTHIVAVGALHFFGEDGIVKLLEDKGYKVEKL